MYVYIYICIYVGLPGWFSSKKSLLSIQETQVRFLGREDPLEKEMANHSSILAWRIPMDKGAWGAIVHVVAGVGHD